MRRKPRRHSSASTALSSSSVICGRQLKTHAPRESGRARLCSDQRNVGLLWVGGTRRKPQASSNGASLSEMVMWHEGSRQRAIHIGRVSCTAWVRDCACCVRGDCGRA